ncbi:MULTISPECIES: hypothetical protein [unclassified Sinorhizobium]|uniref:hypothetical protein n=1 Tax=unclassified Sinorhizobium TaxID=2613772 RepID=UPI0035262DE4
MTQIFSTNHEKANKRPIYQTAGFARTYGLSLAEAEAIFHRYGASRTELDLFMAARRKMPVSHDAVDEREPAALKVNGSRVIGSIRSAFRAIPGKLRSGFPSGIA